MTVGEHRIFVAIRTFTDEDCLAIAGAFKEKLNHVDCARTVDLPGDCLGTVIEVDVWSDQTGKKLEDLPGHDVALALLKIEKGQTPTREELEDLRFAFLQAQRVADAAAGSVPAIVSMVHDPIKGFSTGMQHWATSLLATHLAKEFKDGGGINYLELDMRPCEVEGEAPIGPLTLLIQRKLGKSPGQINGELMAENAKLRAELATLSKKKKRGKK